MEVEFDEIMVGERGRAHDVLATTLPEDVARSLAHNLDLPGQVPPGAQLETYVSGFPHGSRYVFAKTSLDPSAARQGMVFSHALVADSTDVDRLSDVASVFGALRATRPVTFNAAKVAIDVSNIERRGCPLAELCDLLTVSIDGPAVIVGPSALEDIIITLWPRLLPAMRGHLRFRLSFGPEESDVAGVHIVAVPQITATRWPENRVIDQLGGRIHARTAAGRYLTGKLVEDLSDFLDTLSITCTTFRTLELCCRALELSSAEGNFSQALTGLRLIGSLQPDPAKGKSIKAECLDQVAMLPGPKNVEDFLSLRNLDLSPFGERKKFIGQLAAAFNSLLEKETNIDALFPIAQSGFEAGEATEAWQESWRTALSTISPLAGTSVSRLIWSAYPKQPHLAQSLLEVIATLPFMDRVMSASVEYVPVSDLDQISNDLISNGFVLTEATLLLQHVGGDLLEALEQACKRNREQFGTYAVEYILGKMNASEVIEAALQIDNQQVLSEAADIIVAEPTRLNGRSLRVPRLQVLWNQALKLDSDAWRIRQDVHALRNEVFDCLLEGKLASSLIERLLESPLVNALDYSRRSAVWPVLPQTCRQAVERATGDAWIQALPDNASCETFLRPEEHLAMVLAAPRIEAHMATAMRTLSFNQLLNAFFGNEYFGESLLRQVFSTLYDPDSPPTGDEAKRLGRLVVSRGWRDFTRFVMKHYGVGQGLREFFDICAEHLEVWDKWRHGISEPTRTQLYDLLAKTASELYPSGPMESEIWSRAGGNPSKLDTSGSGQRQWEEAIRKIRYGSRVRAENLILEMRDDYPLNEQLTYLEKLRK